MNTQFSVGELDLMVELTEIHQNRFCNTPNGKSREYCQKIERLKLRFKTERIHAAERS